MELNTHTRTRRRCHVGLPWWQVALLAALAMPRVFVHDAGISVAGPLQALLVFVPAAIWVAVAVLRRITTPVMALLAVGGLYGVGLAVAHNIFCSSVFGDRPPELGGNLAGRLDPGTEDLVLRIATSASSLLTGLVVGLICGLLAALILRLKRR